MLLILSLIVVVGFPVGVRLILPWRIVLEMLLFVNLQLLVLISQPVEPFVRECVRSSFNSFTFGCIAILADCYVYSFPLMPHRLHKYLSSN